LTIDSAMINYWKIRYLSPVVNISPFKERIGVNYLIINAFKEVMV
jgi:hypothetical protein